MKLNDIRNPGTNNAIVIVLLIVAAADLVIFIFGGNPALLAFGIINLAVIPMIRSLRN